MVRHHQEKSTPVGTIVGVAVVLLALGGFLLLVKFGVIGGTKPSTPALPPPTTTNTGTGTGTNVQTPTQPGKPPADSGEVRVAFEGAFSKQGDTRKVAYKCPHCGKDIVDVPAPNCLSCSKGIKWPPGVPCGFCSASGKCPACKGDGKCPECAKGGRMLMGVRPPCDMCNQTDKCPACNGTGVCTFCESGKYFPGKPKSSGPAKTEEPPPPIPKPQP